MKKLVALLGAFAGVALMTAQTTPAPDAAAKPAPTAKPVEKEEPPIPGIVIARTSGNGNQLGLTIANGTFKLSFYDKKRKVIPVDVTRAMARWNPNYKAMHEQTILNPIDDGKALGGGKPVLPPYTFIVHLTLLKGDGDSETAVETYTVNVSDAIRPKK
jgi:hypothetical protein